MAVVSVQGSMIGRAERNGPQGSGIREDVSFTLNRADRHAVAFSQEAYDKYVENNTGGSLRASGGMYGGGSETLVYSTSKNFYHTEAEENLANTLVATDYKDPPTVAEEPQYIIRRLTPTECARLQGFPDWWCDVSVRKIRLMKISHTGWRFLKPTEKSWGLPPNQRRKNRSSNG